MLVTKEQQEALVNNYVKEKHNADECIGFIDGIEKTLELVSAIAQRAATDKQNYEQQLREQIAKEIEHDLKAVLENCACLGRDAYGDYIDRMVRVIQNKIKPNK